MQFYFYVAIIISEKRFAVSQAKRSHVSVPEANTVSRVVSEFLGSWVYLWFETDAIFMGVRLLLCQPYFPVSRQRGKISRRFSFIVIQHAAPRVTYHQLTSHFVFIRHNTSRETRDH